MRKAVTNWVPKLRGTARLQVGRKGSSLKSMRTFVRVRHEDKVQELSPGDIIGRVSSATFRIDSPKVSEAHVLVSWRYGAIWLLSLRRLIAIEGKPVSEVKLEPGMKVELADGVVLNIEEIAIPNKVLAIEAPGLGLRPLPQVASLSSGPPPTLVGRFVPDAEAHIWWSGDVWRVSTDENYSDLKIGETLQVGTCEFRVRLINLADTLAPSTKHKGGITRPLRIVSHYESLEIHRNDRPVVAIGGIGARIIGELVACGGPVDWKQASKEIWGAKNSPVHLRRRWDAALNRLRAKLKEAGIRSDLFRSDGAGQLQLVLYEGDVLEDHT